MKHKYKPFLKFDNFDVFSYKHLLDYEDNYMYAYNSESDLKEEDFNSKYNSFLYEDEGLIDDDTNKPPVFDNPELEEKFKEEKKAEREAELKEIEKELFRHSAYVQFLVLRPRYRIRKVRTRRRALTNYNIPISKFITSNLNFLNTSKIINSQKKEKN